MIDVRVKCTPQDARRLEPSNDACEFILCNYHQVIAAMYFAFQVLEIASLTCMSFASPPIEGSSIHCGVGYILLVVYYMTWRLVT